MDKIDWYFDYLSPFAYLQLEHFDRLPAGIEVRCVPVLLGALLEASGTRGPAEVPSMRTLTYRHCLWRARKLGVPYKMPPAHPFNPLRALRLTVALGSSVEVVRTVFRHLWAEGRGLETPADWAALCAGLGVSEAEANALVEAPETKARLRADTEAAVARGVFGVPTFVVGGELFWGFDTTGMLLDFLADRSLFQEAEMARVSALPVGVQRKFS